MKIKTKAADYDYVKNLPKPKRFKPKKPNMFFRTLLKLVGSAELKSVNFKYKTIGIEKIPKGEPALYLMNHSSFIDLEIATNMLYPKPLNIVCTSDGFVGKKWLMRNLGCVPTAKFVTDVALVKDMIFCLKKLKSNILMYPEASYSFDGTSTTLPYGLSKCIKMLKCHVVFIKTEGAFLRDPLYNMLQKRKVNVSATAEYILSPQDTEKMSAEQIAEILKGFFSFDNFLEQQKSKTRVAEIFRADGLNRVLYKCPCCQKEGFMRGEGIYLTCENCNKKWQLTEYGEIRAVDGDDKFTHIPDWYNWERECVKKEIADGTYNLDVPVDIRMMVDMNCVYEIGEGRLTHCADGFHLTGADGRLDYTQKPIASYSLYSDYYWYEIGDMICIGDKNTLYYCFPKNGGDIVAKTRLATEELYKRCQ